VVGLSVPLPGGEQLPPLAGLAAPLPSAGVPGVPASDQVVTGGGLPAGPPDVTSAAAGLTGAELGPLPPGLAAVPDLPAAPTGPTPLPTAPGVPFTPTGGFAAPAAPAVPALPADATAAVPAGAAQVADPTGPVGPVDGAPFDLGAVGPAVPQPPAPLVVPDPPAPVPTPSTPYYFLAESSPYRGGSDRGLDGLAAAALAPLTVDPAQVGVPTLDLTAPAAPDRVAGLSDSPTTGALGAAPGASGSPLYYFTDRITPVSEPAGRTVRGATADLGADPHPPFDVRLVRRDFPILAERVNGHQLVWFDNAATTQKPQAVIDRLTHFYRHENSNIHRAAHELAARATDAYEGARKTVARFLGAESEKNIVFVRGATEAINLVAKSWGKANIHAGDEIIISHLEHHANIVPWQQLCAETGAKLRIIPVDDTGQLLLPEYSRLLSEKTKLVAVTQVSNALGTVTPVEAVVEMAHRAGACVLIDGAQSVPHLRVNLQTLGADFFVFSGHKIYGPTGIGVVYGRTEVLEGMPPWEGGGNMIADVTFERTVFQHPPNRFEAGTGNIADAVGLGAALDYVTRIGLDTIARYEHHLLEYATPRMRAVPGLHMVGTARDKASVLSFVLDGYRTEEVGAALNQKGIAVRSGHHCAQPILRRFGLEATVRPSVAFYNTTDEIDRMLAVLHQLAADRGRR
jgi:cysteine desulfurase/selenocysteine lyase